jgi:tetratricopeptide (TPR) repeat protein
MNPRSVPILAILLGLNLVLSVYLLATRDSRDITPDADSVALSDRVQLRRLQQSLGSLRQDFRLLEEAVTGATPPENRAPGNDSGVDQAVGGLGARLEEIEGSIAMLKHAMDGVSIESASAERAELFAAKDGNLKADEYFEAGKFAIAGEGYLKFLEAHPDHPDHRAILERTRSAFEQAGYRDKAIWAQEELLRIHPETRAEDLMTLAALEKDVGRYDDAARHAAESAALHEDSQRYWNLLYAAWYTQLGKGNPAGLDAYRNVQRQIEAAGYRDSKLGQRAQEKIREIERQIAVTNGNQP